MQLQSDRMEDQQKQLFAPVSVKPEVEAQKLPFQQKKYVQGVYGRQKEIATCGRESGTN